MDDVSQSLGWLQANLLNILMVLVIIAAAFWVAGLVKKLVIRIGESNAHLDDTLFQFLGRRTGQKTGDPHR